MDLSDLLAEADKNEVYMVLSVLSILLLLAGMVALNQESNPEDITNQTPEGGVDVNVSEYTDNQTESCQSPEINESNASQIEQCVSNQTIG